MSTKCIFFSVFFRNYLKSQTVSSMSLPTNMLIWQQHGHGFFQKYQDWNREKIEYVVSQVHLLFVLLKYNHRFFFTLNDLYSSLKITLISVLLIFVYQIHTFLCFFSLIILNHKTCHEFAYQHAYSAATCLLFFCRFAQQHSYSANTFIWQSRVMMNLISLG